MNYKLTDDWGIIASQKKIAVYGLGLMASHYMKKIMDDFEIVCIIDEDKTKQGKDYLGISICSFEQFKEQNNGYKIIIIAESRARSSIKQFLIKEGLTEYQDFCDIERFVSEWYWRFQHKAYLLEMHTAITTRCTFRCKKCNMYIPYIKKTIDMTFEDMRENLDLLFSHIDYVFKYQIVGGEPFLNSDLKKMLDYIGQKYIDKIGYLLIITNGSILPNKDILQIIRKNNFHLSISDYTHSIPYEDRLNTLESLLQEENIDYRRNQSLTWLDMGVPESPNDYKEDELSKHIAECGTSWHGLINKRLYYCNASWAAENARLFQNKNEDYLELSEISKSDEGKEKILSFCLGLNNSFCQICGGCGRDNKKIIDVGEQA